MQKGGERTYFDQVVEDGLKVLVLAIVKRVDAEGAGELPLGLPQGLDAVVVRHPPLERLRPHDPVPSRGGGLLVNGVRRHV